MSCYSSFYSVKIYRNVCNMYTNLYTQCLTFACFYYWMNRQSPLSNHVLSTSITSLYPSKRCFQFFYLVLYLLQRLKFTNLHTRRARAHTTEHVSATFASSRSLLYIRKNIAVDILSTVFCNGASTTEPGSTVLIRSNRNKYLEVSIKGQTSTLVRPGFTLIYRLVRGASHIPAQGSYTHLDNRRSGPVGQGH